MKESPKPYSEIVKQLKKNKEIKVEDRRTVNKLLNELEHKRQIFRVEIDGETFFKLNIFPVKAQCFFSWVDYWRQNDRTGTGASQILLDIKNEVLRNYPATPFEKIIKRRRDYLNLTKPELGGLIKLLKDFEGDTYEHPFG